jgi:hypothetical protein
MAVEAAVGAIERGIQAGCHFRSLGCPWRRERSPDTLCSTRHKRQRKERPRSMRHYTLCFALILLMSLFVGSAEAGSKAHIAPIQSKPHGKSYSQWAAAWWK